MMMPRNCGFPDIVPKGDRSITTLGAAKNRCRLGTVELFGNCYDDLLRLYCNKYVVGW